MEGETPRQFNKAFQRVRPQDISVIIPTFNGRLKLPFVLESLDQQTLSDFEVIVVIDGSKDGTLEYLSSYESKHFSLKFTFQKNQGRAIVRNNGVKLSRGRLLFFVDDDIVLEPDILDSHLIHHNSVEESVLVGSVLLKSDEETDFMKYRRFIEKKWYEALPAYPQQMDSSKLFVTAAHLSMPAALFDSVGGFDDRLRDCEDFELGFRLLKAGYPLFFGHTLRAYHLDDTTCAQYLQRRKQYHSGWLRLNEVNPDSAQMIEVKGATGWLKGWLYKLLKARFWVWAIDAEMCKLLPQFLRYKLYSAALWSHTKTSK